MHDLGSPACGVNLGAASPDPVNLCAPPPLKPAKRGTLRIEFGEDGNKPCAIVDDQGRDLLPALRVKSMRVDVRCSERSSAVIEVEHSAAVAEIPKDRVTFQVAASPSDVDRALDAAGAPHHDERGSLTTAQRVAWLADQRNKWRACVTPFGGKPCAAAPEQRDVQDVLNRTDVAESHKQLDRMHVLREWPDENGRMAKRYVAARIGYLAATMEDIHAELDKAGVIRDGMTVFGRVSAMADRLREYDEALSVVDGAMPRLPTRLARIKRIVAMAKEAMAGVPTPVLDAAGEKALLERVRAAEMAASRLREALGLLSTMAPKMVVGGDRDPVEMAREIHDTVTKRLADAESCVLQDDVRELLRALGIGDYPRPCSPHRVVRDEVLPAIAALRSCHLATELDKLKVAVQPERDRPHPHGQLSNESTTDFAIRLLHELRDVRDAKPTASLGELLAAALDQARREAVKLDIHIAR